MYHSISNAAGPTSISPDTFKAQIELLAECGYRTIGLDAFKEWTEREVDLTARCVVLTFDDGFADFEECAFPILKTHNFTATVFLPSGCIGSTENWDRSSQGLQRRLMSWSQVTALASEKIDFGGHSVTHSDLTKLSHGELEREIRQCRDDIAHRLGRAPLAFAPPYGHTRQRERNEIRKWFRLSLGTRLARATRQCDPFEIPRIEMHYFRDRLRWRHYLQGTGEWYFRARRTLRSLKDLATV